MMRIYILIAICCILSACALKETPRHLAKPVDCKALYVILPGNFIIDLAAGSNVILDPAVQEFALFCTPMDAQKALQSSLSLPMRDDWRIYKLTGSFEDLAEEHENGQYVLKAPAKVDDWLD